MNSNIEQILLAQAAREAERGPKLSDMVALGAGGGAAIGGFMGRGIKGRMAGGLVGMILGGGLGGGAQMQAAQQAGGAGSLLAKIQAQGGMTKEDEVRLELALKQAYSQQGLLG